MVLERSVIRFLYGRPLETLLATWGISLILIQTVRLMFGAQNVDGREPELALGRLRDPARRRAAVQPHRDRVFAAAMVAAVWCCSSARALGLHVRAVTQNRAHGGGHRHPHRARRHA